MGRSVSYLNYAEKVIYFTADWLQVLDEEGNYDYGLSEANHEDFLCNLVYEIKSKLKSYREIEKYEDETMIILQNDLCNIGLSEYCGSWSLSVAPRTDIEYNREALAKNHACKIRNTLEKCLEKACAKVLVRLGTFSNGCNVYEYKNKEVKK